MSSKVTKLNTSSVQGSCEVSAASLSINELMTVIVTKLEMLEKQIDEKIKAMDDKVEKEISHIQEKLNMLGNQIDILNCPSCWQEFQGSCYYFSGNAKTWSKARDICITVNSFLIVIDSKQEQDFVVSKMTLPVWIGLSDEVEEGQWRWADGSPLGQSFWKPGEPNNFDTGEDCAILLKENNWNDFNCEGKFHFICEKTVNCAQPQERKQ
ncbi:C-type lectin domain family 17, member A-like [Sphaerodactylus townsendi]|uniref:C-type lectin domain family 17, member A-like n=1 Tax=Sphaerodactylus townsendi TaxID=933632 RepID=UPI002025F78A|nr:C-type lectin domain family 17, member A-like [Sphaerodactylus townsendi]